VSTANIQQAVNNIEASNADDTRMREDQRATANCSRPHCHANRIEARKPHSDLRRKLPYEEIKCLREQGQTGIAIAKQLGLKAISVNNALRNMGLGTGQHKHKREVLANGRIRCSICRGSKKPSEFQRGSAHCNRCHYAFKVQQSNQGLAQAIHVRKVWIRNRAKRLHIGFELTSEQLAELYLVQCGKCAYCGEPMVIKLGAGRSDHSASIERIIPDKQGGTYTIKNVVWVHFRCNCRRQSMVGEKLKARFPEASRAIERVAVERQLELLFSLDSEITVTNNPEPQPAGA
jgi:hypothetical protein